MTDLELNVLLYARGKADPIAADELAAQTLRLCYAVARRAQGQFRVAPADVDDVAQDAAIKALHAAKSWRPQSAHWSTYVSRIANNVISDWARKHRVRARCEASWLEAHPESVQDGGAE